MNVTEEKTKSFQEYWSEEKISDLVKRNDSLTSFKEFISDRILILLLLSSFWNLVAIYFVFTSNKEGVSALFFIISSLALAYAVVTIFNKIRKI